MAKGLKYLLVYIPVNPKIVLAESFLGSAKPDNVLPLLYDLEGDYKVYVIKKSNIKNDFHSFNSANRFSVKYFILLARAKYIITNSRFPDLYVKKSSQIYIQTWHGVPLKKLVHDMVEFQVPRETKESYLKKFDKEVSRWDYLISPNTYATKCFKSAFKFEGPIIEADYPRNESLKSNDDEKKKAIRNGLGIEKSTRIILYTPTYRESDFESGYKFKLELDLDYLNKILKNTVFLIRCHYLISSKLDIGSFQNAIDVSDYEDINDLYIVSDVLINDYSSTMFDFAILKKPTILFLYDYDFYAHNLRGFYTDIEDLGLLTSKTNEELCNILANKDYESSVISKQTYLPLGIKFNINEIFKREQYEK